MKALTLKYENRRRDLQVSPQDQLRQMRNNKLLRIRRETGDGSGENGRLPQHNPCRPGGAPETGAGALRCSGTVFEQTLQSLKPKVAALDFARVAQSSGAVLRGPDCMEITFLNGKYTVTRDRILDSAGKELLPFLSILIYNHLCMPDPPPPAGEWITFSSVPASHAKDKAWAGHVEEVIARRFAGNVEGLKKACETFGGRSAGIQGNHDAAYEFRFFPRYPVLLLFYDAVPDEDFPAQGSFLTGT
jgi:hypothetical protein